jgi:alpha-amylase/alpha-mannosidase (GH57 family)
MSAVAFLWHLHQPDYRDPETGRPVMPWTRMHALRGYRDLCVETLERRDAATLNLVPVLLDQLEAYAAGQTDDHLDLTRRPADALEPHEVATLRRDFVAGHPKMTEVWPTWVALAGALHGGGPLTTQQLRDAQVWSTLAWFGATAVRDFPVLAALRAKGEGFTEADKAAMLEAQDAILRELPGLFARVACSDHAELCTSPYDHPILPLLVDVQHARRNLDHVPDDLDFAWPEDALLHLTRSRERMSALSGVAPVGVWPSEGSVSPEVVALIGEAGFRWLATDEEILSKSARTGGDRPGGWDLGHGVTGFFRDRELSDRIGFRYAERDPVEAADDLVSAIEARANGGVVAIVLDGENPWEAFGDAGAGFRQALSARLARSPVQPITFAEAATRPPVGRVTELHTGSWIFANFHIWCGHPEDHQAWRLLGEARKAIEHSPHRDAALEHLLPAEGSDWTWWYGDDFDTPFADVFDHAFRLHLRAAYRAAGLEPPTILDRPVRGPRGADVTEPSGPIAPRLDRLAWVHWRGAGELRWPRGGSMSGGAEAPPVRFGWDVDGALWVRADVDDPASTWSVTVDGVSVLLAPQQTEARGLLAASHRGRALVIRLATDVPVGLVLEQGGTRFPAVGELVLPARPAVLWSGV